MRDAPDTLPAALRVPPPRVPPAPPGTGEQGSPAPGMPPLPDFPLEAHISGAVVTLQCLRGLLQAREANGFRTWQHPRAAGLVDQGRTDIQEICKTADQWLAGISDQIRKRDARLADETPLMETLLASFRGLVAILQMGRPGAMLDQDLGVDAFAAAAGGDDLALAGGQPRFVLEVRGLPTVEEMRYLCPVHVARTVIADLRGAVACDAHFASFEALDRNVYHRFLAVLWAARQVMLPHRLLLRGSG